MALPSTNVRQSIAHHELAQVSSSIILDLFNININCEGQYSCLKVLVHLRRLSFAYSLRWFVPTAVLTFLSFVSFWINQNILLRTAILFFSFVSFYLHVVYINTHSPNIPYSNSRDCWLSACAIFIVAALVEYALVRMIGETKEAQESRSCPDPNNNGTCCHKNVHEVIGDMSEMQKSFVIGVITKAIDKWKRSSIATRLDLCSSIVFPFAYTIYIIIFYGCHS